MKIKTKILFVFLALTFLFTGMITGLLGWQLYSDAWQNYRKTSSETLEQANNYIELFWHEIEKNIEFLAQIPDTRESAGCFPNFSQATEAILNQRSELNERGKRLFDLWQSEKKSHPQYAAIYYGYSDGSFGLTDEIEFPAGFDPRKRPWYIDGMKSSELVRITPAYRSFTKELVAAVTCKIKKGSEIIGLAGIDVSLIALEKLIKSLDFGKTGHFMLLEKDGRILSNPADPESVFKMVGEIQEPALEALVSGTDGASSVMYSGKKVLVNVLTGYNGYKIISIVDASEVYATAWQAVKEVVLIGVVMFLVLSGVALFLSRSIGVPLQVLARAATEVAQGNYDALPKSLKFSGEIRLLAENMKQMIAEIKNRIGFSEGVLQGIVIPCALIGPDNKILWTNQQMIDLIGRSQQPEEVVGWHSGKFTFDDENKKTLAAIALKEQRQISGENDNYINFMGEKKAVSITTTPFYDMDGNIQGTISFWVDMTEIKAQQSKIEAQNEKIAATAREAFSVADQMAGATEELSAQIEQSSKGTDIQQERVTETATSMEEMNSTVLEVARNASGAAEGTDAARIKAQDGRSVVVQAIDAISQVQNHTVTLKENMQSLGQQAEDIGNVMNVIADIADQTNLLALNAAIEAARAGEAGRGFAVVADEVRKLAEKTMSATKEVGDAISNIQQGTRGAVLNMDEAAKAVEQATNLASDSGRALGEIVEMVEKASDQVRSIATASEEQSASSEEINMAIGEINRVSTETAEAMTQSAQAVSDLARLAQELNTLIQELADA